jgi:hypothetical protein
MEGYTSGMAKQAGALGLIRAAGNRAKPAYNATKRFFSRRPAIVDEFAPSTAKNVKIDPTGAAKSYVDDVSGYKHTREAPGLLTTARSTLLNAPRIFKNPKADRAMSQAYKAFLGYQGVNKGRELNKKRVAHDQAMQQKAQEATSPEVSAVYNQLTSGNVAKRMVGQGGSFFPDDSPLEPLNTLLDEAMGPAVEEAAKRGVYDTLRTQSGPLISAETPIKDTAKVISKPPLLSSGILQRIAGKVVGKPSNDIEIAQNVLNKSLTPEVREEMGSTLRGRQILTLIDAARKLPPEQSQEFLDKSLQLYEQRGKVGGAVDINSILRKLNVPRQIRYELDPGV